MNIYFYIYNLQVLIILISLFVSASAITFWLFYFRNSKTVFFTPKWLVSLLVSVLWIYFGIYIYVLLVEPSGSVIDPVWFGRTIIRPANVFLFGTLAAIIGYHTKRLWYSNNHNSNRNIDNGKQRTD